MPSCGIRKRGLFSVGLLLGLLAAPGLRPAAAAPQKMVEFNEKGNFLLIGNTVGFDCRAGIPAPVLGTTGACSLTPVVGADARIDDTSGDVLWTSANGTAKADVSVKVGESGSTAFLSIPVGAAVVHARLFWAAQLPSTSTAGQRVQLDAPGGVSRRLNADPAWPGLLSKINGRNYYQSNADITDLVQHNGSGAYRVGAIPTISPVDLDEDVLLVNWHLVVIYRSAGEQTRNIVLYRGLDPVQGLQTTNATLDGFLVPNNGFDGRLGVIGYEGDHDLLGDSFLFNTVAQTNGQNPVNNFFNSSRSMLGGPVSVAGDLPQLSGLPGSMVGLDMDTIDVTAQLKAGDTSAMVSASTTNDVYFLAGFVSSIATLFPVYSDSTKTFVNVSRPDQSVQPGDTVRYTLKILNNGSDSSVATVVRDALPPEILYVPGSLNITSGTNSGAKTDQAGDDQAEYDPTSRTITVRIGAAATALAGGTVAVGETTTIEFLAQVGRAVSGKLVNQAAISAQGAVAVMRGVLRPGLWLSGDGKTPAAPTAFVISCATDLQCGGLRPKCLLDVAAPRCGCTLDADCPGGRVCDTISRSCVECTAAKTGLCDAMTLGGLCLPDNTCGCAADTDCGGRACDLGSLTCPSQRSDLVVLVTPPAMPAAPGTTALYTVQITNLGPDPATNASILTQLPPGVTDASWTCMGVSGGVCPMAAGSGPLPSTVTLPAGGQLIYQLSVPLPQSYASDGAPVRVQALPPAGGRDPDLSNNVGFAEAQVAISTRPDLSVTLEGHPSTSILHGNDYTAIVNNKGTGTAPGASLTVMAPGGGKISNVQPGDGWTCTVTSDQSTLSCTTATAIPPSGSAPPVKFSVSTDPANMAANQDLSGVVAPTDASGLIVTDANPMDNNFTSSLALAGTKVVGGGFGCDITPVGTSAAPLGALFGFLLSATALLRRRRSRSA